ncbi:PhnD/SsuA/transferrin family substrate-binding protein [Carnobacterium sp. 17-4]|uniref:PhnD/SsuA/transferrin family substrate-binding protein n=1 Tax=Carnobacterium sp. (strain 17-4) TaxID=208596 RepID=UPI0002F95056|nr:PhnD/SsuA/transferrin family substrate-binding protein [Carnobacterium sp. 17-4]
MKNVFSKFAVLSMSALVLAACGNSGSATTDSGTASTEDYSDKLTMVWYPNESGSDMEKSREVIGNYIEEATGKEVEHQLTTDYAIAIEAIASGQANLAFMGAQGYVEANEKNENVLPLVVPSGESGTLEDAIYYSWINVKKGNEDQYSDGNGGYSIENIKDKRFSFVSNSSTSGFVVPTSGIVEAFPDENLTQEALMEGGEDKFFSEVLFGGSHQGSAVNLISDRADVAAFCDTCVANYVEPVEGEQNEVGTTYAVREDAADPFSGLAGQKFVSIAVTPVLNAPMVINNDVTSPEDQAALKEIFTSEEMNNDSGIWKDPESEDSALFEKEGDSQFIPAEDAWFDPIRELSEN